MVSKDIFLIGHRGVGKSTIGAQMKGRGWEVIDLDAAIQSQTGQTPAQLVTADVSKFREIENDTLAGLRRVPSKAPRIFVLGAGFENLPADGLVVWVRREGWESVAQSSRERLQPDASFEDEVTWMTQTREPLYFAAADFILDVPRGRSAARATSELDSLLSWADQPGYIGQKSILVLPNSGAFLRAIHRVQRLGLGGIEVRSDLCPDFSADVPEQIRFIASLRHDDPDWLLQHSDASHWDIDLNLLPSVIASGILKTSAVRPLVISSHSRYSPDHADLTELSEVRALFRRTHPDWSDRLILKYAPSGVEGYSQLRELLRLRSVLGGSHILLPQSPAFAWLRPILASRSNILNYVGFGVSGRRMGDIEMIPPWDLRDWLPHLGLARASRFDALVGDPVEDSQGDIWHRRAAELVGQSVGYVRVPVSDGEFEVALEVLKGLGIFNFSVTSPHKRRAADLIESDEVTAVNTLQWRDEWHGCETDSAGMTATLSEIERLGMKPGRVAVIGRGGVSEAIDRAITNSPWDLVFHAGARTGWVSAPEDVDLIINAAGPRMAAQENAPKCRAWIDLHYQNVQQVHDVKIHLNGDLFFAAQAQEQRRYWGYQLPPTMDL